MSRPPVRLRLLVAGFEPFGGQAVNAGWAAIERLREGPPPGAPVAFLQLRTAFAAAERRLLDVLEGLAAGEGEAAVLLLVGQARRPEICLERVAVNLDDCSLPDNDGETADERPIRPGGPAAYIATLPAKALVAELSAAGLPARLSDSAGTFVCNHCFYVALDYAARRGAALRVGLVHVPWTPEQAGERPGTPALATDTTAAALARLVSALLASAV